MKPWLPPEEPDYVTFQDLKLWSREDPPQLVNFVPNPIQAEYLDEMCRNYECDPAKPWAVKGLRENILKSRQVGFSSLLLGLYYQAFHNLDYANVVIITHRTESTNILFQRILTFEQRLPEHKQKAMRFSNRRELVREDTGASMFIGTAGQDDLARSGTISHLHLSETAFWAQGTENIRTGILGTLPDWACLVEETTANGLGSHYNRYMKQKSEMETGGRTKVWFFGWPKSPEYSREIPARELFERTEEEEAVSNLWEAEQKTELTDPQLYWRRCKKKEFDDENRGEIFAQEFPINDIEAFVSSGNGCFDRPYLMKLLPILKSPEWAPEKVETERESHWSGTVWTYVKPEKDHKYALLVDTARGLTDAGDPDYSCAAVLDLVSWEFVCHYKGRPETHDYAEDLDEIGRLYNMALMVVETPGPGENVLTWLMFKCHYPNIYYHRDPLSPSTSMSVAPGYWMSSGDQGTKAVSVSDLASMIIDASKGRPSLILRHPEMVEELIRFVKLRGRRTGAEAGGHDDWCTCARMSPIIISQYGTSLTSLAPRRNTGFKPKVSQTSKLVGRY